jgi:carboxymethylenebutenolidase
MSELSAEQTRLAQLWEEHMRHEFQTCSTEDTLATMVEDAYVNHVPVMTGGAGHAELRQFYATHFIPKMPSDMEMTPLSRTIGTDQLVDEMVVRFTHTVEMDWMLPGIAPTGKRVEVALVVIVHFRDGKLAHEHIYWDQASVLAQLGLIDVATLPVCGADTARKALDPSLPANGRSPGASSQPIGSVKKHRLYRGTESSNPSPSSRESGTNSYRPVMSLPREFHRRPPIRRSGGAAMRGWGRHGCAVAAYRRAPG